MSSVIVVIKAKIYQKNEERKNGKKERESHI